MYDLGLVPELQGKDFFLKKATYWDNWKNLNIDYISDNSTASTLNPLNMISVLLLEN